LKLLVPRAVLLAPWAAATLLPSSQLLLACWAPQALALRLALHQ
jgi:hypothetical protein